MCRPGCKAPFTPQSCRSPACVEDVGGNNRADWDQDHRDGSGRARKSSLTGSHGRLDLPCSMQVLKHDVPQWYMACKSFLCSHPQAGESREDKAPEQQERRNDPPTPVGDKERAAPTSAQEYPRQTCTPPMLSRLPLFNFGNFLSLRWFPCSPFIEHQPGRITTLTGKNSCLRSHLGLPSGRLKPLSLIHI